MRFTSIAVAAVAMTSVEAVNLEAHNHALSHEHQMALAQAGAHAHMQNRGMQHHSVGLSQADEEWGFDDLKKTFNKAKKWVSKKAKKAKKDFGKIADKVKSGDYAGAVNSVKDEIEEAKGDVNDIKNAAEEEKATYSS